MKQELIEAEGTDDLVIHAVVAVDWDEDAQFNADVWNGMVRNGLKETVTLENGQRLTITPSELTTRPAVPVTPSTVIQEADDTGPVHDQI